MEKFKIYTDGAASNNGYPNAIGGWAFIIVDKHNTILHHRYEGVKGATNQQMELMAAIQGCVEGNSLYPQDKFTIYSDSAYLINCYKQEWWKNWRFNGWRNSKKQPVANKELWEALIPFFQNSNFSFIKVEGHSDDSWNNYVDALAVLAKEGVRNYT